MGVPSGAAQVITIAGLALPEMTDNRAEIARIIAYPPVKEHI